MPRWAAWGLLAAFMLATTSGMLSFGVQDNNEGLYATIAKEMLITGQWVVPHLNGVVYLEKPPLLYWMVAASMAVFGHNEVAVRLVPVFFMALTVLGLLRLFAQMGRLRAGYMAAAMLMSAGGFVVMSRSLLFDVPMTCFLMWSLVCFHAWQMGRGRHMLWLFYACLALGVMAKGLTALVLGGGCVVLATLIAERSVRTTLRIFDPLGMLVFLAIATPWHILAELRHPGFADFYFINEHVLRFLNLRKPHDYYHGPFYYYILRLPLYLGLWVLFLPLLLWRTKGRGAGAPPSLPSVLSLSPAPSLPPAPLLSPASLLPPAASQSLPPSSVLPPAEWRGRILLWVVVLLPLLFFSVSRAKANYYWLPSIPALIGLLALAWPSAANAWRGIVWLRWVMAFLLALALLALVALPFVLHLVAIPAPWGQFVGSMQVLLVLLLLACAAIVGFGSLRQRKTQLTFLCICAGGLAPWLLAPRALSLADAELSNRSVAQFFKNEPAGAVVFFRDYEYMSSLGFYLQTPLPIMDCHSNDLYYAHGLERYPQVFIDKEALRQKSQQGRVYLVMRNEAQQSAEGALREEGFKRLRSFRRLTVFANTLSEAPSLVAGESLPTGGQGGAEAATAGEKVQTMAAAGESAQTVAVSELGRGR